MCFKIKKDNVCTICKKSNKVDIYIQYCHNCDEFLYFKNLKP